MLVAGMPLTPEHVGLLAERLLANSMEHGATFDERPWSQLNDGQRQAYSETS
jgi:hypothetical protein